MPKIRSRDYKRTPGAAQKRLFVLSMAPLLATFLAIPAGFEGRTQAIKEPLYLRESTLRDAALSHAALQHPH
jgi:hypothetical protein